MDNARKITLIASFFIIYLKSSSKKTNKKKQLKNQYVVTRRSLQSANMVTTVQIDSSSLRHTLYQGKHMASGHLTRAVEASWNQGSGSGPIRPSSHSASAVINTFRCFFLSIWLDQSQIVEDSWCITNAATHLPHNIGPVKSFRFAAANFWFW